MESSRLSSRRSRSVVLKAASDTIPHKSDLGSEQGVEIDFLQQCLLRLFQLVGGLEDELAGLDINPSIVTKDAARSFIVDVRIALRLEC
ncbi:MAG: hypothetical protein U0V87_00790 [Acidobacteriota bacterium]